MADMAVKSSPFPTASGQVTESKPEQRQPVSLFLCGSGLLPAAAVAMPKILNIDANRADMQKHADMQNTLTCTLACS